jgi:hypothetical protein
MRKCTIVLISFLLVFSLLLTSFGSAKANSGDDPVVTPISGDMVFTSEVVQPSALPGTLPSGQMFVPAGFPANEAQFGGNGVLIKGLDSGKATLCYSFPEVEVKQGWGGRFGMWNGAKWVLLPTTITTADESPNSIACATITGSGTYAFIKYVVDSTLIPQMSVCNFGIDYVFNYDYGYVYGGFDSTHFTIGLNVSISIPTGTPVTYSMINLDPDWTGTIISGLNGFTTVTSFNPSQQWANFDSDIIEISQNPGPSFTAHYVFPTLDCYLNLDYPAYSSWRGG